MFTLETFHTDLHFLENRKGQKIRMLWNDKVIPSKATVIQPKIGTVENGKVVLLYKGCFVHQEIKELQRRSSYQNSDS